MADATGEHQVPGAFGPDVHDAMTDGAGDATDLVVGRRSEAWGQREHPCGVRKKRAAERSGTIHAVRATMRQEAFRGSEAAQTTHQAAATDLGSEAVGGKAARGSAAG